MSGWNVEWASDEQPEGTFAERDAAIADAVSRSEPGDTVTAHQSTCRNPRPDEGCPCGPQVIVVPRAARA